MGSQHRTDAVNAVLVFLGIGSKGGIHSLFQGGQTLGDFNDPGAQNLHPGHIGGLLFDVHTAHVDVAFQTEVGSGGGQRHAVLTGACLSDDLFLAHVLGQQSLAHAVVQLVSAAVVQVLTLGVQLHIAQRAG